jgi:hypothetical protein
MELPDWDALTAAVDAMANLKTNQIEGEKAVSEILTAKYHICIFMNGYSLRVDLIPPVPWSLQHVHNGHGIIVQHLSLQMGPSRQHLPVRPWLLVTAPTFKTIHTILGVQPISHPTHACRGWENAHVQTIK